MAGENQDRSHETRTRAQIKREEHKRKSAERAAETDSLQHSYARIKDEPAFKDILAKAKSFAAYHTKMAKDGVGYRDTGQFDAKGDAIQEIVYYDQPKRLSELDKASGIEELEGYILRMLNPVSIGAVVPSSPEIPVAGESGADKPADQPIA